MLKLVLHKHDGKKWKDFPADPWETIIVSHTGDGIGRCIVQTASDQVGERVQTAQRSNGQRPGSSMSPLTSIRNGWSTPMVFSFSPNKVH